jgi:ABC-type phosphate transport system substrate-binding protein
VDKNKKLDMIVNNIKIWKIESLDVLQLKDIFVESIVYDSELTITLKSNNIKILLKFERFESYRVNDESNLLEYWEELDAKNENGYVFYEIFNSSYYSEIKKLSKDFFSGGGDSDSIKHYGIFSINECVEVLSDLPPIVVYSEY